MFISPSPDIIKEFNLKHYTHEIVIKAKIPTIPSSEELLISEKKVTVVTETLKYPIKKLYNTIYILALINLINRLY